MKIMVTGGGGFLGQAICRLLRARGDEVVSVSRSHHPALDALGVQQRAVDIAVLAPLLEASHDIEAVIHSAAKAGAWGELEDYYSANVAGTENVIEVCRELGIRRLVYTSTPSVVHAGGDLQGVDESVPYATAFKAHYPRTKAMAERRVLAANDERLATVALRPHLIWGPGDNHLLPRIVARAKAGRLRLIGRERKKIDVVFVDNAAQAHLDALDRVAPGAACAGNAYFISQGQPIYTDEMINGLLKACGLPPETRRVPFALAYAAGAVLEAVYTVARIAAEPPLTRFIVEQLGTAHWYDISAARRDLGYAPTISIEQGLIQVAQWWMTQGKAQLATAAQ